MIGERDEHDPVELTGIDKAIEDCTAAVVTELDDGEHEELRASIRMLIDFVKQTRKPPTNAECETEAASYYVATRGLRRSMTTKEALLHAYEEGMRRTYRS